ncbi:reverse transcriptase domain-containing protein [Tanacetum coccineum]
MKFRPSNEDTCHAADIIDLSVVSNMKEILPQDHDNSIEPILYQLPKIHEDDDNPALFTANSIDDEKPTPKLKELPSHLEYAFLDNNRELPIIISSLLSDQEKGISPSFCTHKILMEENSKPTVQPQRRLNPKVQVVVKIEILKLLEAGLIYAISDSPWDMCKDFMEVFMDDFSVFRNSFKTCLNNLSKMIARCEETKLVLNWEKYHFMVKEGIVLGHKISKAGIKVNKAKVNVIASLPYPTNIKDFELMCDASDYAVGAVLRKRIEKNSAQFIMQEFTIKIKDKKGTENLAADHLSRLENLVLEELSEDTIQDNFPDEHLMGKLRTRWYGPYDGSKSLRYGKQSEGTISINGGLIQAILTSLPPQPIGEATKASNLQRISLGVQGRTHFRTMAGVDVDTLTMEQYLALSRENQPQKDGWTDSPQELSTPGIFSKKPLSKGLGAGPIFGMRPAKAITAIQTMADHSQKWHDGITSRNIGSSSSKDGLAVLVNKLDNLGRDMKKLKESVHAIQVGCQNCKGPHLNKDCPLNGEVKQVEEVRYGEFRRTMPFDKNNRGRQTLAETVKKYIEEASVRQVKQYEWLKTFCHNLEKSQNHHDEIIQSLKSKVTTLAKETETETDNNEDCKAIFTNDGAPLYTPFYYSPEEIEYFSANSGFSDDEELKNDLVANKPLTIENEDIRINRRCSALLLNQLPLKEKDTGSFILPCSIRRLDFNNALADLGASISIMPFSMYKRLGIGKLERIKMNIELADNSKCIPKGIVRNLLIKIDKFILPIDFIILDVLEDYRMPVILGRLLLITAHAKIDVFKRSISLEVGSKKVIFKLKSNLPDMKNESVLMIQSNIITEENELMNIESDLFTYNTNTCELCYIFAIDTDLFTYEVVTQETYEEITHKCCLTTQDVIGEKTNPILGKRKSHWCTPIYRQNNRIQEVWASCNPLNEGCDRGSLRNNEIRCYWESENDNERVSIEWNDLSLNDWLKIKYGEVDETMKKKILTEHWRKRFGIDYDDSDDFYDPTNVGKVKIRNTRKDHSIQKLGGNYRDRLDSYSFGNLAEFAAVTA